MKTFTLTHLSKVYLLLLCLFVAAKASINAQVSNSVQNVPSPQTHSEQNDQLLRFVDKSPINTGILYDRAFPLADVESFNGQLDAGTSHSEHFFQTYYEFYLSNYNNSGRLSPQQLRASVDEYANSNYYPIGLMCMKYNVIDGNAVSDNLLQYDSGSNALYDVQGRPRSPYLERTTLVVAPLLHIHTPVMRPGIHTFALSGQFIFTNAGIAINYCQIDFGDGGGWRTLNNNNSSVSINYPTPGDRTIHTVAYLNNGQQLHAYSVARVAAANSDSDPWANWNDEAVCNQSPTVIDITGHPFNPSQYGETNIYGAEGKVSIYFAKGNCQSKVLRKPVVFIDGFDPENTRDYKRIYKEFINDEDVREGGYNLKLGDRLRNDGYDMVIVDYKDGGDYIERNGLMIIKVLEELWSRYSSTIEQQFVVIGPSMGALVGQYALAEAERRGINTHTRLFISFDGPHQGANIPIGLQQAIGYALKSKISEPTPGNACRRNTSGIVEDDFALNVRSAKQMLVHHYLTGQETPTAHPYRNIFLQNMNTVGYPNNCRKIAIINGSKAAYGQRSGQKLETAMLPSEQILFARVRKGVDLLKWNMNASPINNRQNTLHAFTANIISKLNGLEQFRDEYAYPYNFATNRSVDILPGGYTNTMAQIVEEVNKEETRQFPIASVCLNIGSNRVISLGAVFAFRFFLQLKVKLKRGQNFEVQSNTPIHSFVTTLSAVDFKDGTPLSYNFENENLVCTGKTPFNYVYAPLDNQPHVAVTPETAIWFENEIKQQNIPAACSGGNATCANTGNISYQRWENIGGGTSIQDLRNNTNNLNNSPSNSQNLTLFEAPTNILDNYGVRMRGYVCPPTSGNYTFWVAGDDNAELWLSPNDQPNNLSRIAYHNSWTPPREWNLFSTQQSAPVFLQAGQRYYVEALMKEGGGGDNLAVGWQLPNGSLERPIPGNRLIPFEGGGGNPPATGCGSGTGLTAKYYNGQDLQGNPVATLTQGPVDFAGNDGQPIGNSNVAGSNVSVRWEGQIEAPATGSYTFNIRTDDGVRLWLDNQQRVDDYGNYPPTDHNFTVNLTAGQKYNLKIEWKQGVGGYEAKFFWNYPGQGNQIVPACRLYPTSGGGGCTPPNAPSLSANPASINAGQSSTLSASGCGGTVSWNTNQTGNSITVNPAQTTTYTATCSENGCTSGSSSVTVTVNGGGCGSGTGLTAKYYNGQDLQGNPVATLTQGPVDFAGNDGQPIGNSNVAGSNVSVRWEGQIEAPATGSYTFNIRTDDGVRLWLDNQQRVDDYGNYPPTDHNFTVNLTAGQKYNLKIEWKQGVGGYEAKFFWSYPGQGNQIVPACRLYPTSGGGGNPSGGSVGNGCYVISPMSDQSKGFQLMGDNTIFIQSLNGQLNQVWKFEQVGSQYKITANGSSNGPAIGVNSADFGEWLRGQGYTASSNQQWTFTAAAGNQYKVSLSAGNTWDVAGGGSGPQVQLWGLLPDNDFHSQQPYRFFKLTSATCASGGRVSAELFGSSQLPEADLVLSPNPTDGQVRVETWLAEAGAVQIAVQDLTGRTAKGFDFEAKSGNFSQLLNLTDLPVGVYVLQLQTPQKRFVKKLVLVR